VLDSDAILVVEGRADVLNLLKFGIKNAIAVEGTNVPQLVAELSKKKTVTVFTDGDRGGELILKELLQVADVDFVARAPDGKGVEELTQKEVIKALRSKVPVEQVVEVPQRRRNKQITPSSEKDKGQPMSEAAQALAARPAEAAQAQPQAPAQKEYPQREYPQREERRERTERGETPRRKSLRRGSEEGSERREAPRRDDRREDRRGEERREERREPREQREPRESREPREQVAPRKEKEPSEFDGIMKELSGTLSAKLLDANKNVLKTVAVRDLANTHKETNGDVKSVVFDGVITQRMLDIAAEKNLDFLVGVKMGSIVKQPANVKVITSE
jgi:DNA primase